MFSRDNQFSHDRKIIQDTDSALDDHLRREKLTGHFSNSPSTISKASVPNTSEVSLEVPLIERSQSWQVAPNLFISFKYAWAGISYAFTTQRNFRVHTGLGTIAILLCWALDVSTVEIAVICLTIGAVLVMEILNTALESLVDLTVGQTYHQLAKVAKDCAAGAVLMAAIVALLIAALIFVPPLWVILWDNLPMQLA